jgi:hypothetical protein
MTSATSTTMTTSPTMTMPSTIQDTGGVWILITLSKATLALTRRQFLEALQAGKRWRRRAQFQARQPKERPCRP